MQKIIIVIVGLLVVAFVGFLILGNSPVVDDEVDPSISSIEECLAAGYSALDSYPEQCETPDGKRFVRNLPIEELDEVITPIVVTGTIVCLPHWDMSGAVTLECAYGLLSDDGDYYVLRDPDPMQSTIMTISTDTYVQVTGTFIPGSHQSYRSIGTIEVESVSTIEM